MVSECGCEFTPGVWRCASYRRDPGWSMSAD